MKDIPNMLMWISENQFCLRDNMEGCIKVTVNNVIDGNNISSSLEQWLKLHLYSIYRHDLETDEWTNKKGRLNHSAIDM